MRGSTADRRHCRLQVKALEAAEAARRKEAQKATERAAQRQQVEAQKAERAKRAHDAKVGCNSLALRPQGRTQYSFAAPKADVHNPCNTIQQVGVTMFTGWASV